MNSQHDRSITTSIAKMAGTFGKQGVTLAVGEVVSVDKATRTCTVAILTNETEVNLEGVKLQTMVGDGILLIPSIGSNVTLIYATKQDAVIVQCSDLDGVEFFGGQLGGLVKVNDLVTRLNNIEDDIKSLKQAFSSWSPVPSDGGAALKATSTTWAETPLAKTVKGDIENTKIKQ
jgi:hypothetical protein